MFRRERSPTSPTLATAQEQGLKDFTADNWLAFFLPKGTPGAVVQKLHEASVAALNTPAVTARLKEVGADPVAPDRRSPRSEEHTSELQSRLHLVCRLLLGKKNPLRHSQ